MTDKGPVRVTVNVEAHPTTADYEIDRDEWDAMTPAERREYLGQMVEDEITNAGGAGYYLPDAADESDLEG